MHATDRGPRSYAPPEGNPRDVFNEAPRKEDRLVEAEASKQAVLGKEAVVHTTYGDIRIKLFPEECPRTIENFSCVTTWRVPLRACSCLGRSTCGRTAGPAAVWSCCCVGCRVAVALPGVLAVPPPSLCSVHSRKGYYNGCIFHRVIKNFMVQTGDPLGTFALMCSIDVLAVVCCSPRTRVLVSHLSLSLLRATAAAWWLDVGCRQRHGW